MASNPYAPYNPLGVPLATGMASSLTNQINAIPQPVKAVAGAATTTPSAATSAATAATAQAQKDFANQKNSLYSSITDATANAGTTLNSSILDYIDSLRSGQRSIDNQAVNNDLAKAQGTQDVYGMVGRGIQSGGVTLANKNASSSSAAEALARAYGDIGRRELTSVGNQYEMGNRDIQQSQLSFDEQSASGVRKLQESKVQAVNSIVDTARTQIAALNAAAASADISDRLDIEREKENIKAKVLSDLQQYDQQITSARGSITAMTPEQRAAEANRLANAGTAPESSFNYTSEVPLQYQNTGPFSTQLPIFTYNGKKQTA